ncbi:hypothetical protein OTK49_01040 [Vibrio coralliirubri]|uniref:hypothetical protein n=1 Tax=Vibrio coralliirubri TaxID=1516159 RepID=UPI0022834556|nr:hypothetical protein [Vibrio coralliirubri]MCY9861114.1 hypothetical protein [Vibrio coralliirubri]
MISFKIKVGVALAPSNASNQADESFSGITNIEKHFNFRHTGNESDVELAFGDTLLDMCPAGLPRVSVFVGGVALTPSGYNELKVLGVEFPNFIETVLIKNYVDDIFIFARDTHIASQKHPHSKDSRSLTQRVTLVAGNVIPLWKLIVFMEGVSMSYVENLGNGFIFNFETKTIPEAIVLANALLSFCFTDHSNVNIKNRENNLADNIRCLIPNCTCSIESLIGVIEVIVFGYEYTLLDKKTNSELHQSQRHVGWR